MLHARDGGGRPIDLPAGHPVRPVGLVPPTVWPRVGTHEHRAFLCQVKRMERVTGIAGVFFRARGPEPLSRWYAEHLGVDSPPESYDDSSWSQQEGPIVFAPFPADSEHFGSAGQQWAINFRVRDLDAMVAQLRDAGVAVDVHESRYPNGRFADLNDPEGNPVQLSQPACADAV